MTVIGDVIVDLTQNKSKRWVVVDIHTNGYQRYIMKYINEEGNLTEFTYDTPFWAASEYMVKTGRWDFDKGIEIDGENSDGY